MVVTGPAALALTFAGFLVLGLALGLIVRMIESFCTSAESPRFPSAPFARADREDTQNND